MNRREIDQKTNERLEAGPKMQFQRDFSIWSTFENGILCMSKINLTTESARYIQRMDNETYTEQKEISYRQLFLKEQLQIANDSDRRRYQITFSSQALLAACARGENDVVLEYRRKRNDGRVIWVAHSAKLVPNAAGEIYAYISIRDIDDRKILELTLKRKAERDSLTGTYNKETAIAMVEKAMEESRQKKASYALAIFNVDDFHILLSQSGYETADEVLRELGSLLLLKFGDKKIVGRSYGDELFVFVYDGPDQQMVRKNAKEVCHFLSIPYMFPNSPKMLRISAGVVFDHDRNTSFAELYDKARIALVHAQLESKEQMVVYQRNMEMLPEKFLKSRREKADRNPTVGAGGQNLLLKDILALSNYSVLSDAVNVVLMELCRYYQADRAYLVIFNQNRETTNVYEWKKEDAKSVKCVREFTWMSGERWKQFSEHIRKQPYVDDIEAIKKFPQIYRMCRTVGAESFYASLLEAGADTTGLLLVDNPAGNIDELGLLETVNHFLENEICRYQLQEELEYLSYHDSLTDLLNRNSYAEYCRNIQEESLISLGVLSVDINCLKMMNQAYGNKFGDEIISYLADMLKEVFRQDRIYRMNGDEFIVVSENCTQESFAEKIELLKQKCQRGCNISLGYTWSDQDFALDILIKHADERRAIMKQAYYNERDDDKEMNASIRRSLLKSLASNEFKVYLQPKLDIVRMCRELGIEVVAEGVEQSEQVTILKDLECEYIQGYICNKPLPVRSFEELYLLQDAQGRVL